ncbi:hypothetical protein [Streptomyces sp. RFCAC02]|uniref:hypothetical protein n=1 Tax=Streptomyces sp. RFCAC02 TaxID=2499143 RepID=UPI00101F99A1|nr:hypothetical protein [Streptomyces sp. RFCAC02]
MNIDLIHDVPDGLSRRARSFIGVHGVRAGVRPVEQRRPWWLERGVPAAVIDRMAAYQRRWGGLVLPPASQYEGGPKCLDPDGPEPDAGGWWFEAGTQRTAVPYGFMISPSGEFGIHGDRWVPLHATVDGWVEALALTHHAAMWARGITKLFGDAVDGIDLAGFEPVRETRGVADTWWRGADSLVVLYTGEAELYDHPGSRCALIYSGLDEWGLHGGT